MSHVIENEQHVHMFIIININSCFATIFVVYVICDDHYYAH